MIPSNSGRLRPAIVEPTTMSSCPLKRMNKTFNTASNIMNSVTPALTAERFERRAQLLRQAAGPFGAAIGLQRRSGEVRGQIERRLIPRPAVLPVGQMRCHRRAMEPSLLPHGEVGVTRRQRRQIARRFSTPAS